MKPLAHWRYYFRLFFNSFVLSLLGAAFLCVFCFLGQDVQGGPLFPMGQSAPAGFSADQQVTGSPDLIFPLPAQWLPYAEAAAGWVQKYAYLIPAPLRLLQQVFYKFLIMGG